MSDFSECVIIPLTVYNEKCNLDKQPRDKALREDMNLLYDESIPADQKVKLYTQQTKMRPVEPKYQKVEIVKPAEKEVSRNSFQGDVESILQSISKKNTPFANSILLKILQQPSLIDWNEKLEVKINGVPIFASNIVELLRYVLGEKVVTKSTDVPIGAQEFYLTLSKIGVPASWLKIRSSQVGLGSWIDLYP